MKRGAVILALVALGVTTDASHAQSYEIEWHSVDGGAGVSTGGPYVLSGTIGQPDAGNLAGGSYDLQGGFWPGIGIPSTVEAPRLFLRWDLDGVTVSWLPATPDFSLETTEDLGSGIWDTVPDGDTSPVIVPVDTETRFFRLAKP